MATNIYQNLDEEDFEPEALETDPVGIESVEETTNEEMVGFADPVNQSLKGFDPTRFLFAGPLPGTAPPGYETSTEETRRAYIDENLSPVEDIDFSETGQRGYLFEGPVVPEGFEAVYGGIERDPFRADWSEGQFVLPESYTGRTLTGEEKALYEQADDYLFNLNIEARDNNFNSVEDYMSALRQYDPDQFYARQEMVNRFAPVVNDLRDIYQYEKALGAAQFRSEQGPINQEDLLDYASNFAGVLVQSGALSPEEAAFMLSSPEGITQLMQGQDSVGGFPAEPLEPSVSPELFYFDDDQNQERPYVVSGGQYVPWVDPDWVVYNDSYYQDSDGDGVPEFVRSVGDYQEPAVSMPGEDSPTDEVDSSGNAVTYFDNDPNRLRPYTRDSLGGFTPAIMEDQEYDPTTGTVYNVDPSTGGLSIARPSIEYDIGPEDRIFQDEEENFSFERGSDLSFDQLPVDLDGFYDLEADIERAGADVLDAYFGDGARLDIGEDLRTNFGKEGLSYRGREDFFRQVSLEEYEELPGDQKTTNQRRVNLGTLDDRDYSFVTDYYVLRNPEDVYTARPDNNLFELERSSWQFSDSEINNDLFNELVQTRPYKKKSRRSRAFSPDRVGSAWGSKGEGYWIQDLYLQEFILKELSEYLDLTGKRLNAVAGQKHDDILSTSEDENVFSVKDFLYGNQWAEGPSRELGWDGMLNGEFRNVYEESGFTGLGTNEELDEAKYLERFAFITAALTKKINDRVEQESNRRSSNQEFDRDLSIPSSYVEMYGRPEVREPEPVTDPLEFSSGGYVGGIAGGMDDTVPALTDGQNMAALSSGEFVIPADVVSHLGDGNNENGASKLYRFMDDVRTVKTGNPEQPDPFNDGIFSNLIGVNRG
tara:strand:- start:3140 stop:5773 length:2634 start_codon:yes stop_codon:yes gene_type:complete